MGNATIYDTTTGSLKDRNSSERMAKAWAHQWGTCYIETKAYVWDVEVAPGAHQYHSSQRLAWNLNAPDDWVRKRYGPWEDQLTRLDLSVDHLMRGSVGQAVLE